MGAMEDTSGQRQESHLLKWTPIAGIQEDIMVLKDHDVLAVKTSMAHLV